MIEDEYEDKYDPSLSQHDIEHNTYIRLKDEYTEMKEMRKKVNKTGIIFIGISSIVFLALMFSLESKLFFLVLWIIIIICTVAYLIHNEYKIYKLRIYLGYENENENDEDDEEDDDDDKNDDKDESKKKSNKKQDKESKGDDK
ncbi:MAG: hypothetical protein ACI4GV_09745 [Acutalibacteraceae bacterium]